MTLVLTLTLAVPAFAVVDDTGFSDVDTDAWYAEAVMYCREHNLMAGIGNNQFDPESSLTRAQLATVLYRDDFSGKTIVPFCSMGGGHFGQTISAIAKLAPNSVIKERLEVTYSSYDRAEISEWLESIAQ